MSGDQERLSGYVETWAGAVEDVVALLHGLDEQDWQRPTDLPGWSVLDVACHLAHLEAELAGAVSGAAGDESEAGERAQSQKGARALGSDYTEQGVQERRGCTPQQVVEELTDASQRYLERLRADPPTDPAAVPEPTPGGIGWTWETLLSNRVVDVWMHEQDIRRAVARPGGLNGSAAAHTAQVFTMSFPFVVGKRVSPPAGSTVLLDVRGAHPVHLAVEIGEDGRAHVAAEDPQRPTVALQMDLETFVVLSGGRRSPEQVEVAVAGDEELGRRVLAAMAVTP